MKDRWITTENFANASKSITWACRMAATGIDAIGAAGGRGGAAGGVVGIGEAAWGGGGGGGGAAAAGSAFALGGAAELPPEPAPALIRAF